MAIPAMSVCTSRQQYSTAQLFLSLLLVLIYIMKMASATRTWAMVNKHIPMIKFRRTDGSNEHGSVLQQLVGNAKPMNSEMSSKKSMLSVSLEDWQLTSKYKRKPMSQEEIDYVNTGGPQ